MRHEDIQDASGECAPQRTSFQYQRIGHGQHGREINRATLRMQTPNAENLSLKNPSLRSGSLWVLCAKVAGALAAYALAALISRQWGAQHYGAFELAVVLTWILAMVGRLGLDGAWVKHGAQGVAAGGFRSLRSAISSALVVAGVSVILGLGLTAWRGGVASGFESPELEWMLGWGWAAVPGLALLGLAAEMLRGANCMAAYAWLQRGAVLCVVMVGCILVPNGNPFAWFAGGAMALAVVAIGLALRTYAVPVGGHEVSLGQLFHTGWPMLLAAATFEMMSWTDTLLCGIYLDEVDVGRYRLAFRLSALLTLGQAAINSAIAPRIAQAHAHHPNRLEPMLSQAARWNWGIALSGVVFLGVFGAEILPCFDADFGDASTESVLYWLLVGSAFNAICGPVLTFMNMTGDERPARNVVLVAAVVNLLLNLWWIPIHGMAGAAMATVAATILWNLSALIHVRKHHGIWMFWPALATRYPGEQNE